MGDWNGSRLRFIERLVRPVNLRGSVRQMSNASRSSTPGFEFRIGRSETPRGASIEEILKKFQEPALAY